MFSFCSLGPAWLGNETFFSRPWTMPRPEWDSGPHLGHCQYRFPIGGVVPCSPGKMTGPKANKLYPVYEMNPTSLKPFGNIAALRNAKMVNFLNMSTWMPHTIHVRSSDVQTLRGVNSLVSDLVDKYGLHACEVRRDKRYVSTLGGNSGASSSAASQVKTPSWELLTPHSWNVSAPPLPPDVQKWITCNLDWNVEGLLGFKPKQDPAKVCPNGGMNGNPWPFDFLYAGNLTALVGGNKRTGFFYKIFDGIASTEATSRSPKATTPG